MFSHDSPDDRVVLRRAVRVLRRHPEYAEQRDKLEEAIQEHISFFCRAIYAIRNDPVNRQRKRGSLQYQVGKTIEELIESNLSALLSGKLGLKHMLNECQSSQPIREYRVSLPQSVCLSPRSF